MAGNRAALRIGREASAAVVPVSPSARQLRKRRAAMIARGAHADGGFTTRSVHASAVRWLADEKAPQRMACISANLEITVDDPGDGDNASCCIRASTHGYPMGRDEDVILADSVRSDALEVLAAALTEAVRLGKERGMLTG